MKRQLLTMILFVTLCQPLLARTEIPDYLRAEMEEYFFDPCALRMAENDGILDTHTKEEALVIMKAVAGKTIQETMESLYWLVKNVEPKAERIEVYKVYDNMCGQGAE